MFFARRVLRASVVLICYSVEFSIQDSSKPFPRWLCGSNTSHEFFKRIAADLLNFPRQCQIVFGLVDDQRSGLSESSKFVVVQPTKNHWYAWFSSNDLRAKVTSASRKGDHLCIVIPWAYVPIPLTLSFVAWTVGIKPSQYCFYALGVFALENNCILLFSTEMNGIGKNNCRWQQTRMSPKRNYKSRSEKLCSC